MRIDPIAAVVSYLRSLPDVPGVTGDMNSREVGQATVYVEHYGGFRVSRYTEERVDISYEVYHLDREAAMQLALKVSEYFISDLPGRVTGGAYVLDVEELKFPYYEPDATSREHVYCGEVAVFYVNN